MVTVISAIATYYMDSIVGAWKFLIAVGAGAGLVFMLRWFWWRINAWSEISAMSAAAVSSLFLQSRLATGFVNLLRGFDSKLPAGPLDANDAHGFAWLMILTTSFTTISWLTVTLLTAPEPEEKLRSFYRKVQPATAGWKRVAELEGIQSSQNLLWTAADWAAGCGMIYCSLFGIGSIIFGQMGRGIALLIFAVLFLRFIWWDLSRRGWESLS
jgi:hypothetical protein